MGILILVTGGTFDNEYDEITGELVFRNTHIPNMLEEGRAKIPYKIRNLMMLDSLHMSDELRELISQNYQIPR